MNGTIDPIWNAEFIFGESADIVELIKHESIEIVLKDEDRMDHSGDIVYTDLGKVVLRLNECLEGGKRLSPQWFPLVPTENMKTTSGRLLCSLRVAGCPDLEIPSPRRLVASTSSPRRSPHRLEINPSSPQRSPQKLLSPAPLSPSKRIPIKDNIRFTIALYKVQEACTTLTAVGTEF